MSEENNQYYFNFSFFKVDPKWRWMADLAKEESAKEVENVINNSGIMYRTYSNLGLRDDADFLIWFAAKSVEEIQKVQSKLLHMGAWLATTPQSPSMKALTNLPEADAEHLEAAPEDLVMKGDRVAVRGSESYSVPL